MGTACGGKSPELEKKSNGMVKNVVKLLSI